MKVVALAALSLAVFCGAARADVIVSGTYTGNLSLNDSSYGLMCGGCDYNGPATISFTVDITQLQSCSSSPGNDSSCSDPNNNGDVTMTLAFSAYNYAFSNNGGAAPYGENAAQLWSCATSCTGFGVQASNSAIQAPPDGGEMWAYFYNFSDPYTTQSVQNAGDIYTVTNNTAYVQGYVGDQFGANSAYWDYFLINNLQVVSPEPGTWMLFALGLGGLIFYRRRAARCN
ncbi:MAG TPA: PEP-CTERM sorting domain-containing protein [Bryobacteraceae bacterium]|nr:PEP-CTERM sorting domain-containing protein [Bryobacteraceae bacterium]